jgi:HSP20 family protein
MFLVPRQNQSVVWRSPFAEIDRLHREMGRLFDGLPAAVDKDTALFCGAWSPAVDVIDQKDAILVKADLPGLSKDDLDVSIENNVLTIRGEKKEESNQKDGEVVRAERYYGMFQRTFTLPTSVDPSKVEAKFRDGVLELKITKKEEAKPRQIKVEVK